MGSDSNKGKRKSVPRTSTGCITCKLRHIKCDENFPSCLKCLKSKRQCDGYGKLGSVSDQKAVKIVHWQPKAYTISRLSVDMAGNEQERRAFHFFRSKSITDMPGYFDMKFWNQVVLQASHTVPTIRHAVIALGSFHETTEASPFEVLNNGKACDVFALHQCNKAIENLSQNISAEGNQSIDVILMSVILLICFECLQGKYESAITHIQFAMRIFSNWQEENVKPASLGQSDSARVQKMVDGEIFQMLFRLNVQVLLFPDTHLLSLEFFTQNFDTLLPPLPEAFCSINKARDSLYKCMNYVARSGARVALFRSQGFGSDSKEMLMEFQVNLLQKWSSAFHKFKQSCSAKLGAKDHQAAMVLEMWCSAVKAMVSGGLPPDESIFDAFEYDFERIVLLAPTLMEVPGTLEISPRRGRFSFEMGIVPLLYFTATRCRDPAIRHHALSMLSTTSHQEGIWNSKVLTVIARRLVLMEEGDSGQVTSSADIPATRRLSVTNATIFSEDRKILLGLRRPAGDSDGGYCRLQEWITY